jgi:Ribonuclease G/E
MTRKRSGKTLVQQLMNICPMCNSAGYILSVATISFDILTQFQSEVARKKLKGELKLSVSPAVFNYLVNVEFESILNIEKILHCKIILEENNNLEITKFSVD